MSVNASSASVPTPSIADGSNTNPPTRTVSLVPTEILSTSSRENVLEQADLATFFGSNAPPTAPSQPPVPATHQWTPDAAKKEFLSLVALSEIPPSDKRYDGKTETRGLQRDVHALTQATADIVATVVEARMETVDIVTELEARVTTIESRLKAAVPDAAAQRDNIYVNERLDLLGVEMTRIDSQVGAIFSAVNSLVVRVDSLTAAPPAAAALPAPAAALPSTGAALPVAAAAVPAAALVPVHAVPALLPPVPAAPPMPEAPAVAAFAPAPANAHAAASVTYKRPHSPSEDDNVRNVRQHLATAPTATVPPPAAFAAPVVQQYVPAAPPMATYAHMAPTYAPAAPAAPYAAAAPIAPPYAASVPIASAYAAAPQPVIPPYAAPLSTPTLQPIAPPPVPTYATAAPAPQAVAPAPAPQPVMTAPHVAVAYPVSISAPVSIVPTATNAPPALPPVDPSREVRFGPAAWGKNISGEASTVIKTVLPAAKGIMRSFRARKGPDQLTIIGCFESAEIVNWFIPAFNASRVAPYSTIFASPNV
ncbi:hypothetical protein MSAN_01746500 [Mycena sanguinolenta]|uniref:Uncharacterized protein n=1 Tax=Mycena sanguinolenta TaxID=230812 RepID=A0A8H6XX98_9AGAR|nr:hypothetical protein MSAN_01746500 [Mycena sanguinolenta]